MAASSWHRAAKSASESLFTPLGVMLSPPSPVLGGKEIVALLSTCTCTAIGGADPSLNRNCWHMLPMLIPELCPLLSLVLDCLLATEREQLLLHVDQMWRPPQSASAANCGINIGGLDKV